jgi:glutathione S-transferase
VNEARATLDLSFGMIEERMRTRDWVCGQDFSMADCSAAPAVFYSGWVHSWGDKRPALTNYFERLMARPSIARTYEEAKPFMQFFPFHENVPQRFR